MGSEGTKGGTIGGLGGGLGGGTGGGTAVDLLVVDNDERIVELVAWFLEKRGYRVRSAATFEDARRRIAERRPTLMLSDLDLGAENALEELPRMLQAGELPPTLVVSGFLDAATIERLNELPAVLGTLSKPFDFHVLEERICSCLERLPLEPGSGSPAPSPDPAAVGRTVREDDEGWIEIVPARPPGAAGAPVSP